jgi:YceI-like domain
MKTSRILFLLLTLALAIPVAAQDVFMTRNGKISFFSKTPMENIDAINNEVLSVIDLKKNEIAFAVLIKGFHFERALMEEHFNENYMESTKYPKATFNGTIRPTGTLDVRKDGVYPVDVEGDLTIHGTTRKATAKGELVVNEGKMSSKSTFRLIVKDFNIEIPGVVADKIAETIDVTVECAYVPK